MYMPYLMISFNNMLTNDIVSFEQLGPAVCSENNALSRAMTDYTLPPKEMHDLDFLSL